MNKFTNKFVEPICRFHKFNDEFAKRISETVKNEMETKIRSVNMIFINRFVTTNRFIYIIIYNIASIYSIFISF